MIKNLSIACTDFSCAILNKTLVVFISNKKNIKIFLRA